MNKLYSLLLAFWVSFAALGQTGYHIKGNVKGIKPEAFTLGHYFGASQYITKDTTQADANGNLLFEGAKALPGGLYMILSPSKKRVMDLIIGAEQHFSFSTDTANIVGHMQVKGSPDSELYYKYQQHVSGYTSEINLLQRQLQFRQDLMTTTKINNLRRQLMEYYKQFAQENSNSLTGKIMRAGAEVELPTPPKRPDGKPDSAWLFHYYKAHFWDNFDFSDERLVRTPILQRKIDRYMQELTLQQTDSLIQSADFIIEKALKAGNKEMQAYCIWYLTNQAENPTIIGGDAVFVHLADKYYLGGLMPITDPTTVENIREKVNTIKPVLVGKTMPALSLTDTAGKAISLNDLKNKYVILFFYDPDCGHCRQSTPALKALQEKYKTTLDLQVFAASVARAPEQWKKYIRDFGVQNWVHGYDYSFRINFRKDYDVNNTPMIYVLDKNKKIIARRIPVEQLEGFLDYYEQTLSAK